MRTELLNIQMHVMLSHSRTYLDDLVQEASWPCLVKKNFVKAQKKVCNNEIHRIM